jgi:hypothetical protein
LFTRVKTCPNEGCTASGSDLPAPVITVRI